MKRQTIFNTLILTLMVFSSLFVANLSPHIKVSAESIVVRAVSGNKYKDSSGNYYKKENDSFYKYEPIVWYVCNYDSSSKRALLVSEKLLLTEYWDLGASFYAGGQYLHSTLETFTDESFSTDEMSKILPTSGVGDKDATTYATTGTYMHTMFILSSEDVKIYSLINNLVCRDFTKYAFDNWDGSGYSDAISNCFLRNSGAIINAQDVDYSSLEEENAHDMSYGFNGGIAPAMYLNTSGLTFYSDANCTTTTSAAAKTYIKFGSYPQTIADCTTTIDIPAAGVSINTAGIVLSSSILVGLFVWMGFIAKSAIKSRKRK